MGVQIKQMINSRSNSNKGKRLSTLSSLTDGYPSQFRFHSLFQVQSIFFLKQKQLTLYTSYLLVVNSIYNMRITRSYLNHFVDTLEKRNSNYCNLKIPHYKYLFTPHTDN